MKFGFLNLGDLTVDPIGGGVPTAQRRLDEIVEQAELTEALGFHSFGVGEHHSGRWAVSAPPVVLGAIAARTERIRLRTGITLLSNLDPVRVAEDYATVDLLSGGRLDLTVAKGNFPQPWALFGQDVAEQRERLAEGIDLLREIRAARGGELEWEGVYRSPLHGVTVGPSPPAEPTEDLVRCRHCAGERRLRRGARSADRGASARARGRRSGTP